MFIPPLRIALNGGGIRGLAHIGALEVLEERGHLSCVKEIVGVSAGAFCAFCICIGYTLSEMKLLSLKLDIGSLRTIEPETVFQFPEAYGFDSGETMEKLFTILLREKGYPPTLTFRELFEARASAPALRIFVTDLNTCLPYEYSAARTPDAEVRMAVRASISIPIYFTPVMDPHTGHMIVDSVLLSDSPFSFLTEEERKHTLNLVFHTGDASVDSITTLFGFLRQLYYTSCNGGMSPDLLNQWNRNIVLLDCGSISAMQFEMTEEEKAALIGVGRSGMLRFLEKGVCPGSVWKPRGRRFSQP